MYLPNPSKCTDAARACPSRYMTSSWPFTMVTSTGSPRRCPVKQAWRRWRGWQNWRRSTSPARLSSIATSGSSGLWLNEAPIQHAPRTMRRVDWPGSSNRTPASIARDIGKSSSCFESLASNSLASNSTASEDVLSGNESREGNSVSCGGEVDFVRFTFSFGAAVGQASATSLVGLSAAVPPQRGHFLQCAEVLSCSDRCNFGEFQ